MFDTIASIWAGFLGKLSNYKESRKLVWLLLASFIAGWLATAFASWISYPAYLGMIDFLPGSDRIAAAFTVGIAAFIYFDLAYVGGFLVERWKRVPADLQNYSALGFRIFFFSGIVFLSADFYMNQAGATYRADEAGGERIVSVYSPDPEAVAQLRADKGRLAGVESGKIGGYGWEDPQGRWRLNGTGKRMAADLRASIRRAEKVDSTAMAVYLADVEAANSKKEQRRSKAAATLKNGVYGVYLFIFLLCIVQAYIVETIQAATFTESSALKGKKSVKARKPGFFQRFRESIAPAPAAPGGAVATEAGYLIQCEKCGKEAIKKAPNARFCTDQCRQEAWESRTGAKVKKGGNGRKAKTTKIGF